MKKSELSLCLIVFFLFFFSTVYKPPKKLHVRMFNISLTEVQLSLKLSSEDPNIDCRDVRNDFMKTE